MRGRRLPFPGRARHRRGPGHGWRAALVRRPPAPPRTAKWRPACRSRTVAASSTTVSAPTTGRPGRTADRNGSRPRSQSPHPRGPIARSPPAPERTSDAPAARSSRSGSRAGHPDQRSRTAAARPALRRPPRLWPSCCRASPYRPARTSLRGSRRTMPRTRGSNRRYATPLPSRSDPRPSPWPRPARRCRSGRGRPAAPARPAPGTGRPPRCHSSASTRPVAARLR